MAKIGFIGIGNMGSAMLKGSLSVFGKDDLTFFDTNADFCKKIEDETGVKGKETAQELVKAVKYIILAIKPQVYDIVLNQIKDFVTPDQVIISIAPTYTISMVKERMGDHARVVRAMPNTPAMVGEGMTGIAAEKSLFTEEELINVEKFFSSFGKCAFIHEDLMSAVVCASGSSPAYVFMFIEALADSVVKYGMPRNEAYKFAAQSVLGSAKMVLETGIVPATLKDNVCSPGGTTIRAVEKLEENGFRNSVFKATKACYDKCEGRED